MLERTVDIIMEEKKISRDMIATFTHFRAVILRRRIQPTSSYSVLKSGTRERCISKLVIFKVILLTVKFKMLLK